MHTSPFCPMFGNRYTFLSSVINHFFDIFLRLFNKIVFWRYACNLLFFPLKKKLINTFFFHEYFFLYLKKISGKKCLVFSKQYFVSMVFVDRFWLMKYIFEGLLFNYFCNTLVLACMINQSRVSLYKYGEFYSSIGITRVNNNNHTIQIRKISIVTFLL